VLQLTSVLLVVNQLLTSPVYYVISYDGEFSFIPVSQVVEPCFEQQQQTHTKTISDTFEVL